MELHKLSFASDDAVEALLGRVGKTLQLKIKGPKELNESLKLLFQLISLKGLSNLDIPNEIVVQLFLLVEDDMIGMKNRLLAVAILGVIMEGGMPVLQDDFARYKDKSAAHYVRMLIQTAGDEKALLLNGHHIVSPIISPSPMRIASIPLLAHFLRKYTRVSLKKSTNKIGTSLSRPASNTSLQTTSPASQPSSKEANIFGVSTPLGWLDDSTLTSLTQSLESILVRTPSQAARDPNATNLFSALSGSGKPAMPLNDVDGQASRAFFSPLLDSQFLSEDQISHHTLLLCMENLLNQFYEPIVSSNRVQEGYPFSNALSSLLDSIYKYISRVMDQIKFCQKMELKALTGVATNEENAFFIFPSVEPKEMREARISRGAKYPDLLQSICLRLLASLCRLDGKRVDSSWRLLSKSCLAMSGVEVNFLQGSGEESNKGLDSQGHSGIGAGGKSSRDGPNFDRAPRPTSGAMLINSWYGSLGVPAGLVLGFSSAFLYPATCSALFFGPSSVLTFGTSPERLHANSALLVLEFILEHLLFSKNAPLQPLFINQGGLLPFSIEYLFRSFFDSFLSLYYQDPVIAYDTFRFLQRHAKQLNGGTLDAQQNFIPPLRLSTHVNSVGQHLTFFECFYKILVKMTAWHGMPLKSLFEEHILPASVTASIHLELLQYLIDMPLLTCCMEMVEPELKLMIMSTPVGQMPSSSASLVTSVVYYLHQHSQSQQQQQTMMMQQQLAQSMSSSGSLNGSQFNAAFGSGPQSSYHSGVYNSSSTGSMGSMGSLGSLGQGGAAASFGSISGLPSSSGLGQPSLLSPGGVYIDKYRSILNMMMWNESGVIGTMWGNSSSLASTRRRSGSSSTSSHFSFSSMRTPADSLLNSFWNDCKVTPRVLASCQLSISALSILLKIAIQQANQQQLEELVMTLLERMERCFPLNTFQGAVQMLFINTLASAFEKCPSMIVTMQQVILDVISDSDAAAMMMKTAPLSNSSGGATWREELTMCLVWIVGKYANPNVVDSCTYQVMADYDEALELLAFEKMSILSMEMSESSSKPSSVDSNSSLMPKSWKEYKKAQQDARSRQNAASTKPPQGSYSAIQEAQLTPTARLLLILSSSLTKMASRCLPLASRVKLCLAKILRYPKTQAPPASIIRWAHHCLNILKFPSIAASIMESSGAEAQNTASTSKPLPWQSPESFVASSLPEDQTVSVEPNGDEAGPSTDLHHGQTEEKNPGLDFSSSSAFLVDQRTSLSFLLHRIDYSLNMHHDGDLGSLMQSTTSEPSRNVPSDFSSSLVSRSSHSNQKAVSNKSSNNAMDGLFGDDEDDDEIFAEGTSAGHSHNNRVQHKLHPFVI